MNVEISEKEIVAIMASAFALRNSREVKYGGTFVENIRDKNSRQIPFAKAVNVVYDLIDRIMEGE